MSSHSEEQIMQTPNNTAELLATSTGSPWRSPKTAPKTGVILADFGWPWPVITTWCKVNKEWSMPQIAPYARGESICWETEWGKSSDMKGWMPLPELPKRKANNSDH